MEWCSREDDYFDSKEFKTKNGVRMHEPPNGEPHRAERGPSQRPPRAMKRSLARLRRVIRSGRARR
jgi:hypothetical protein